MVKPLSFKGDKPKKRKRARAAAATTDDDDDSKDGSSSKQLRSTTASAAAEPIADDDTWVAADAPSDVSGPVMFVLPTEPPAALACDAAGKVYILPIENMVDANPATAEPHDVRQVWVANRIAGTEHFRFKGHHGRYLACDRIGLLSAHSEAVSPLETFALVATADTPGTFQVQTLRDTLLCVTSTTGAASATRDEVRGDADTISFATTLRIRMQARFKPRIKASKEEKALAKISRRELEEAVGRRLDDDEVRKLKRARREGDYHETLLDVKVKSKHDKFS
ncbi:FRG1-like family protein [Cordyceps militaris CM01]|uniref:FRG1-like family protein n=2 Tax=Cordyceps militaris TaxID=73501 RepID=G3JQX0_CORMM|nr:FRG1-like family protein [Cordyceps militaris CM01]ATY61397.1 FRG1-like family [Cordyceps militaris]EGX89414.1 FRG1-like family protein [Cordyceps militaris CM01]